MFAKKTVLLSFSLLLGGFSAAYGQSAAPAGDGIARVFFETKGRGGKGVTVIRGLGLAEDALAALGKKLKAACGVGGTAKDGVVELQGEEAARERRPLLRQELADDLDGLREAAHAPPEVDAVRGVLVDLPPRPDPQHHPAARQVIDRRRAVGQERRVVHRRRRQ